MIVGIAGRKRVGKTMLATRLEAAGYERLSFSSTLKAMARTMLINVGLTAGEVVAAEADKEAIIPQLGVSYRWILQSLGTDWGRVCVNADMWVMAALNEIRQRRVWCANLVFDDVRFENEAALIRSEGGIIIHLRRDAVLSLDDHASESGIDVHERDFVIDNNGKCADMFVDAFAMIDSAESVAA